MGSTQYTAELERDGDIVTVTVKDGTTSILSIELPFQCASLAEQLVSILCAALCKGSITPL